MDSKLTELKYRLQEIADLNAASAVLSWDMSTYMPPGGAASRGRGVGLLARLSHERFTDPVIGRLLDDLQSYGKSLPYDTDDAALLRKTRRDYERQTRLPNDFVSTLTEHASTTYALWEQARPANDFARVRDALEKMLDLSRQLANYFPGYESIIDPLIDDTDYGMKASSVRAVFTQLREQLVPLVKAIAAQPPADESPVKQHYPEAG
jgi:carboxypeptidase Taq